MASRQGQATAALLLVTAIWGSTFFIIKDALHTIDPFDYLVVRFLIASVVSGVIFFRRLRRLTAMEWKIGLGLGAVYGIAQIAQTTGLARTSASVSGFITGTYVVITPVILWLLYRVRPARNVWLAVALSITGLAVLSLTGFSAGGIGEVLTFAGAATYALHIVLLDKFAAKVDAMALTVLQLIGVTVVCFPFSLREGVSVPPTLNVWGAILYTAVVAGIITMLLQTWSQKHLPATRVAILMTFEPVFASTFAVIFGSDQLTLRLVLGGTLIFLATVIGVGLPVFSRRRRTADTTCPT